MYKQTTIRVKAAELREILGLEEFDINQSAGGFLRGGFSVSGNFVDRNLIYELLIDYIFEREITGESLDRSMFSAEFVMDRGLGVRDRMIFTEIVVSKGGEVY